MTSLRIGVVGRPTTAGALTTFKPLEPYLQALESAGLEPARIRLHRAGEGLDAIASGLDGLLLPGGGDVDPRYYGEEPLRTTHSVSPALDDTELRLTRWALEHDLPILAICRGMQLLNVAAGGTLYQDLPAQYAGAIKHHRSPTWKIKDELAHAVRIEPGSRLAALLGTTETMVNTRHHQAVKALGAGLVAVAWAVDDKVIEGIEMPAQRFVVGVQWHPENLLDVAPAMRGLFRGLAEAAGG